MLPRSSGPGSGICELFDKKNLGLEEDCPIEHDATDTDIASRAGGMLKTAGDGRFEVVKGVRLLMLRREGGLDGADGDGDAELEDEDEVDPVNCA